VFVIGFGNIVLAQQIKADVVFHTVQLPLEEKEYIEGLDRKLADVINAYPWVERGYQYELPLRVELFFEKGTRSVIYHRYSAGVMIATRSGVQLRDSRWDFRYSRDFNLRIGDKDDPFVSLIEFYAWICLGFELDRFSPLGGQPYYEKARLIAENARFEIDFYNGWDYRRDFIRDLTHDKYREIRTAAFHATAGIFYTEKGKSETARSHLSRAAELLMSGLPQQMELLRDDNIIRFINVREFIDALAKVEAFMLIERLAKWDPEHPERYSL